MKKENRKLAQELRAAERKKKAFLRRLKRILTVVIPLLAVLILVSVIVWDSVSSKEEETASNLSLIHIFISIFLWRKSPNIDMMIPAKIQETFR